MKITLEIELLPNGEWGLDMSRVFTDASNMPVNVIYAHGENLAWQQVELRIEGAVEKIMTELEGVHDELHDEFPSASVGPEVAL